MDCFFCVSAIASSGRSGRGSKASGINTEIARVFDCFVKTSCILHPSKQTTRLLGAPPWVGSHMKVATSRKTWAESAISFEGLHVVTALSGPEFAAGVPVRHCAMGNTACKFQAGGWLWRNSLLIRCTFPGQLRSASVCAGLALRFFMREFIPCKLPAQGIDTSWVSAAASKVLDSRQSRS